MALSVASVGSGLSGPARPYSRRPSSARKPALGGEGEPRAGGRVLSCTSSATHPSRALLLPGPSPLHQGDTSQPHPAALGVLGRRLGSDPREKSRDAEQTHRGAEGLSSGPMPAMEHGGMSSSGMWGFIHNGRDQPRRPAHRLPPAGESGTTGVDRVPLWSSTLPHPPNALRHFLES